MIAKRDEKWGERPLLLVEVRDGQRISDEELVSHLRGRIASWWIPDAVVRLDRLPVAATGKIDKILLRQLHGGA